MKKTDLLIIGASAAGLMCAIEAGKRQRSCLVLDHANKPGKKILMSGGGRCNFTNLQIQADRYLSHNPHFCKSALNQFTQYEFIDLVKKHHIPYHEKKHGQLFCDRSSKDILNMLLAECETQQVPVQLKTTIVDVKQKSDHCFVVKTNQGDYQCESLVIATGGLSIPTLGASPFGYQLATQFGLKVYPTRAGLVPLTLLPEDKERFAPLSGISSESIVTANKTTFHEDCLFTHRGLSGPSILQISSYWQPGEPLKINLIPNVDLIAAFQQQKKNKPNMKLKEFFNPYLAKRIISTFLGEERSNQPLQIFSQATFQKIADEFQSWTIKPNGSEGYRTAEVTLGGIDTAAFSSKTMECKTIKGLYCIGEVLDVTGWLGGYNFQWAWSSGWVAGQHA